MKRLAWPTKITELPDRGGKVPEPPPNSVTIVLDERGQAFSSTELAKKLETWRDGGKLRLELKAIGTSELAELMRTFAAS